MTRLPLLAVFITCFGGHIAFGADYIDTGMQTPMALPTFTDVVGKLLIGSQTGDMQQQQPMSDGNMTATLVNRREATSSDERKLRRGKRYLDFLQGSRMSWRTNAKNNIEAISLFAYGYGFRVNFNFPNKEDRLRPFYKRDLFRAMETALDGHGFDGRACLLKSYCSANLDGPKRGGGMMFKLLQIVFSLNSHERRHLPYMTTKNCAQLLQSHCPLDYHSMSTHTDDV